MGGKNTLLNEEKKLTVPNLSCFQLGFLKILIPENCLVWISIQLFWQYKIVFFFSLNELGMFFFLFFENQDLQGHKKSYYISHIHTHARTHASFDTFSFEKKKAKQKKKLFMSWEKLLDSTNKNFHHMHKLHSVMMWPRELTSSIFFCYYFSWSH